MLAGELRQRVTIEARTEVSDQHDGYVETWAVVQSRIPARVKPLIGRDLERARQVDPRVSHEVTVRYWRAYPTELHGGRARVVYHDLADRTFEMVAPPIDVEEQHIELMLLCKEEA